MMRFSATLVFFLCFYSSRACSCAETSIEKDYAICDVVFLGNVIQVQKLDSSNCLFVKVILEVSEMFKGEETQRIEVVTAYQPSACGFDFNVCNEYLVFAYISAQDDATKGKYSTSSCNMTMHSITSYEPIQLISKLRSSN